VKQLGEQAILAPLAVGTLGMLGLILAIALGWLPPDGRTIFASIAVVMFLVAVLTFAAVASPDPEECVFQED